MRIQRVNVAAALLSFVFPATYFIPPAISGPELPALVSSAVPAPTPPDLEAQKIEKRDRAENGITVGEPRVYDDAQLQQRLQELEARLAMLQLVEQKALSDRLGAVSGASQQISSVGFNVQGPSVPGVTTNTKLPTETTTQITAAGATSGSLQTVSNLATEDVQTTKPQFAPPPVTAPAPTTTLPSAFSVSSSDVLNEMMQLTAEINGLRLMLSGDLSSHYIRGGPGLGNKMTKLKTTLGFDISVKPDERYQDAVAIVEVEVENVCATVSNEPPAIAALLPREKTYNVAAITDKSTSISGGVATQIVGFSGSWLRGHKTHYVVQDQDTVALTFTPEEQPTDTCPVRGGGNRTKKRVGFLWQFRPVLGRRIVRIADKTTFVRLALSVPPDASDTEIGKVTVRSYWRRFDRKRGVQKSIIPGSVRGHFLNALPFDIPRYELAVDPTVFNFRDSLEDLGGGNVLVKLPGRFLPGTNVRIGPVVLTEGDRFKHRYSGIRFVATLSDLTTRKVFLVAHDGTEVQLAFGGLLCTAASPLLMTAVPQVTTIDETNSRVKLQVNHPEWAKVDSADWLNPTPPIVFVIGQRVFGFSDAPLQRNGAELSFLAPTALLVANPQVTVQTLFPTDGCIANAHFASFQPPSQTERMVLLEQGGAKIKFLLYGSRLNGLTVLAPAGVIPQSIGTPADNDRLVLIVLDAAHIKSHKYILVQRPNEPPFAINIPSLEAPKKPDPPKARERITVGSDEAVIDGEGLKDVSKVFFRKTQFASTNVEIAEDGKSLRLSGLGALGVTATAATQTIVLELRSGSKVNVALDVVNSKIETVVKSLP
ncbi:MAG: hypothetical protein M3539_13655 [Acidobacteriota bacterium]|nr:hypothetical protein [Acidobacteriota bacterium]